MASTPKRQPASPHANPRLAWFTAVAIAFVACTPLSFAQATAQVHRTLTVTAAEPLTLDVDILRGDVEILYGRDGQLSISGIARASANAKLDDNFFSGVLNIEQVGNHVTIRHVPYPSYDEEGVKVSYRIDVPYRTQVTSGVNEGKQNISGIMGPVKATTGNGDIKASYVSKGVQAEVGSGNLDLQVVGEHVEATTGQGNISCSRLEQGVSAETGEGDITLMVVGPSIARVKRGNGRIDVGGARGSFIGSTDEGDVHVRAVPHDGWELRSASGNIRLELPPSAKFDLEASTTSGELQVDRDDIAKPPFNIRQLTQTVNGGGKRIQVRAGSGRIVIR
jgi:DUF4097 and DUF4098 domain-containing protein YvlB